MEQAKRGPRAAGIRVVADQPYGAGAQHAKTTLQEQAEAAEMEDLRQRMIARSLRKQRELLHQALHHQAPADLSGYVLLKRADLMQLLQQHYPTLLNEELEDEAAKLIYAYPRPVDD